MEKINWKAEIPAIVIVVVMLISAIVTYPMLPEQLPIHWNVYGEVDNYLAKNPLSAMLFPFLGLFIWALFKVLPSIDPKKEKYRQFRREYAILQRAILAFFLFLHSVVSANTLGHTVPVDLVIPFGVGLLFMILGNYMGKIRKNYFVGIKYPWTLENETVWNKTHRFGGKLFVITGIAMICAVVLPPVFRVGVLFGSAILIVSGTLVYSWIVYKKEMHRKTGTSQ